MKELKDLLQRPDGRDVSQTVLVSDCLGALASFIPTHYAQESLQREDTIFCLVGVENSFTHYFHTLKKLTINLKGHIESGRAIFIDCLSPDEGAKTPSPNYHFHNLSRGGVRAFFDVVRSALSVALAEKKRIALVVDSFGSVLDVSGASIAEAGELARNLELLCSLNEESVFVPIVHGDAVDGTTIGYLRERAQVELQAKELGTGFSKDVHGQLSITASWDRLRVSKTHLFKATDLTVKIVSSNSIL